MNPLLYSSNEMFSSTELIRKSKMIFDKLLKSEVEKAIILRDGKPGFMLLEFEKYEELMKEYMALKEQAQTNTSIEVEPKTEEEVILKVADINEPQESLKIEKEHKKPIVEVQNVEETSAEQFEHIEEDISEDDLKKALEEIEKLDFDDSKEEKKGGGIEEFDFQDEFIDVAKEKKEQPLKEFWD
eukprot:Anaeramoba_flamelloidesa568447_44.p2 GENE.a568447_44~~a568447_44.p2  ORF type:complete len:185 (+),score=34.13 a568447_44:143-697(+)